MNDLGKKFVSAALAGTVIAGVPATASATTFTVDDALAIEQTVQTEQKVDYYTYTAVEGDTFEILSIRYFEEATHAEKMAQYNNMNVNDPINVGQEIKIPKTLKVLYGSEFTGLNKEARFIQMAYPDDVVYVVKAGDTLSKIIKENYPIGNQTKIEKVAYYNNIEDINLIYEGQEILLPCEEKLVRIELPGMSMTYDYDSNEVVINNDSMLRLGK